jgi:carboxyl-terminal processing protease
LRLTTAKYYTPGGQVIHGHGIAPDVELAISAEDDRKLGIQRLRGDLTDRAAFKERFDFEPIADRQLEAAIDVLHGVLVFAPSPTLSPAQLASHTLP